MIDLSGQWTGSYAYPGCLDPIPFSAELRDANGRLSGLISECGSGLGYALPQTATLSGGHDDTTVEFTKIYDSHDERLDAIAYRGDLQDDGHEISGSWTIVGDWSGPFVMTTQRKARVEAEVEVGATV